MKKEKLNIKKIASEMIISIIVGVFIGIFLVFLEYTKNINLMDFSILHLLLFALIAFLTSIFIHELGHLVMGLLTGYHFLSFRFLNIHVQKDVDGKFKFYSYWIPSTLGQCLMKPSENITHFCYHFGGVFFNILISLISVMIIMITGNKLLIQFLIVMILVNLGVGKMNWMSFKGVLNDGHNYRLIKNNPKTKKAITYLLDMNAHLSEGHEMETYDIEPIISLDLKGEDTIQLNVLMYLVQYYQLKFDSENYQHYTELAYQNLKGPSTILSLLIETDYYFMRLLLGYEDAGKYKTKNVERILKSISKQESVLLMRMIETYILEKRFDEDLYHAFLIQCEKSTTKGLAKSLQNYAEKIISLF